MTSKLKSVIDYLIFILSAVVITGVILGVQEKSWITVTGYLLSLFWMLSFVGIRGALRASRENNAVLKILVDEMTKMLDEKEKK